MKGIKVMTVKEVERTLIDMNEKTFDNFVSKLPKDVANVIIMHRAWLKLFCDVDYYNAVKKAVTDKVAKDIWKEENENKKQ